jgi:hypothetical protein
MVLWRALRSPIGGKDSLFALALKDEGGLDGATLDPLAENVLYFGLSFLDDSVQDVNAAPDASGPLVLWDSTRGLLPAGEGYNGFRHARGRESLIDPDDDVFPEAIRIAVIVTAPPGERPVATTVGEIPAGTGSARVELNNGQYLRRLGEIAQVVKLGQEWVSAAPSDGSTLQIVQRGLFGTTPVVHPDGTKVLTGRRFERLVPLPSPRFDLISRDVKATHR